MISQPQSRGDSWEAGSAKHGFGNLEVVRNEEGTPEGPWLAARELRFKPHRV